MKWSNEQRRVTRGKNNALKKGKIKARSMKREARDLNRARRRAGAQVVDPQGDRAEMTCLSRDLKEAGT